MDYLATLKKETEINIQKYDLLENRKILIQNIIDNYNIYGYNFYNHIMNSINSYNSIEKRSLKESEFCKL